MLNKIRFIHLIIISLMCCNHLLASANLEESLINQLTQMPTTREDWEVKGNYREDACSGGRLTNIENYNSLLDDNLVKELSIRRYFYPIENVLYICLNEKYKFCYADLCKYCKTNRDTIFLDFGFKLSDTINKSLQFFYKINAIPDFIIDRILEFPEFGVQDFRLDAEKLIGKIEQKFAASTTGDHYNAEQLPVIEAEDLMEFIQTEIKTIKDNQQLQETCWGVVQYLKAQDFCPDKMILELCQYIIDNKLPFYSAAQQLIAEIQFMQKVEDKDDKLVDIYNHYREPIVNLLKASVPDEHNHPVPPLLPVLIKSFVNNDKLSDNLPEVLADFRYTPENMYELLNLYRLQNQEIEMLRDENVQLKRFRAAVMPQ